MSKYFWTVLDEIYAVLSSSEYLIEDSQKTIPYFPSDAFKVFFSKIYFYPTDVYLFPLLSFYGLVETL